MKYGIYNISDGNFKRKGQGESLPEPREGELVFELSSGQKAEGMVAVQVESEWELQESEQWMPLVEQSILQIIRNKRNALLAESDWTQMPDSPLSVEDKALWATYRQSLRDLPEDINLAELSDAEEASFPSKPGEGE